MKLAKTLVVFKFFVVLLLILFPCHANSIDDSSYTQAVKADITPWIRISSPLNNMKVSPSGNLIAFTDKDGLDLRVIEVRSAKVYEVSKHFVGVSYLWAPDDCRLFFTERFRNQNEKVESSLRSYDCSTKNTTLLEKYPDVISLLTFDPRDMKLHLLSRGTLHRKTINISNQRLDSWRTASKLKQRRWIAADSGIFLFSNDGRNVTKLNDDDSGVQSFDISKDGENIAWSTNKGNIYVSRAGDDPEKIGEGVDPNWHPNKLQLVYAAVKKLGSKVMDFDLAVVDEEGRTKFITNTTQYKERWPNWNKDGDQIIFTVEGTTDIFSADFKDI